MPIHPVAYLARINYSGDRSPSIESLRAIHLAHVLTVPFENLDGYRGVPVSLEPADLFTKIVTARRGGYCFELNGLFSLLLEAMGFEVTRLIARVRYGAKPPYPRSHQVLLVRVGREPWLADVGFGGNGLLEPMPLEAGAEVTQHSETFKLKSADGGEYLLQCRVHGEWDSLYSFTTEACLPIDYKYPNYFHSHSPDSIFMQRRICTIPTTEGRKILVDRTLSVRRQGKTEKSSAESEGDYARLLHDHFGIVL